MNKPLLDCEVVRDLLPTYIDGLCNEKTNELIKAHLQACPECRAAESTMRAGVSVGQSVTMPELGVDFLQKQKRKNHRLAVGIIVAVAAFITVVAVLVYSVSWRPIPYEYVEIAVTENDDGTTSFDTYLLGRYAGLGTTQSSAYYLQANGKPYTPPATGDWNLEGIHEYVFEQHYRPLDLWLQNSSKGPHNEGDTPERRLYRSFGMYIDRMAPDGLRVVYYRQGNEYIPIWQADEAA